MVFFCHPERSEESSPNTQVNAMLVAARRRCFTTLHIKDILKLAAGVMVRRSNHVWWPELFAIGANALALCLCAHGSSASP